MNQTLVIGHVALIQASKKQCFTLALVKALRDKGFDAVGVFAGECREQGYMAILEEKIKQFGLDGSVVFLGKRNDIPDLLKVVDILIIPSAFEGFPLAGLEAAAAGVPVAACNIAGAEEFIRVSGNGVSFAEDDIEKAIGAIEEIMVNRAQIVQCGRAFAVKMSNSEYAGSIRAEFECVIKEN